jgi:hypothetical protein
MNYIVPDFATGFLASAACIGRDNLSCHRVSVRSTIPYEIDAKLSHIKIAALSSRCVRNYPDNINQSLLLISSD